MKLERMATIVGPTRAAALLGTYTLHQIANTDPAIIAETARIPYSVAVRAKAAVNLASDLALESVADGPTLDNPAAVAEFVAPVFAGDTSEAARIITLNARYRPIGVHTITTGLLDHCLMHAREVFRMAIVDNAKAIVITHNHPSGHPLPGEADIRITRELIRAGQLLRIDVADHVIIGLKSPSCFRGFCSMRELGYFAI